MSKHKLNREQRLQMVEMYKTLWNEGIKWKDRAERISKHFNIDLDNKTISDIVRDIRDTKYYNDFSKQIESKWFESNSWKHWWTKTEDSSIFVKNPNFSQNNINDILEKFEEIASKYIENDIPQIQSKIISQDKVMNVIITDEHIGMDVKSEWLFCYEYNSEIYQEKYQGVLWNILKEFKLHWKVKKLNIINLWDRQDWWQWETTRWWHKLPQNMTMWEVFDVCVKTRLSLVDSIYNEDIAEEICMIDVCNDNHAWDFWEVIFNGINNILEMRNYKKMNRKILTRFMDHEVFWNHCIIFTHWKDAHHMKSNFPLHLNDKVVKLISNYIDHYWITSKYIHVYKWDLHQIGFDKTRKFDYRNFMSFAPPSPWVQHNFWDSYSWYSIEVIPYDTNEITHTDYFLDYNIKKWKKFGEI